MKDLIAFVHQNTWFVIFIVAVACVLSGRIWSDKINRGEITDPQLIIRKGKSYKIINTYVPGTWTEDWIVGSIICLKSYDKRFFVRFSRNRYVSGDRIRFTDNGPVIGSFYQAIATKKTTGTIVMKPVKAP
jgi:hypothetical protein